MLDVLAPIFCCQLQIIYQFQLLFVVTVLNLWHSNCCIFLISIGYWFLFHHLGFFFFLVRTGVGGKYMVSNRTFFEKKRKKNKPTKGGLSYVESHRKAIRCSVPTENGNNNTVGFVSHFICGWLFFFPFFLFCKSFLVVLSLGKSYFY